ncbi:MAG: tripartite tricarboxylate transporter TctB family protein [Pseudomonadota bacterium]
MKLRADYIAGGAFAALGIVVFILGWDLPFGRITAPGAGMLPKLLAGMMIAFAVVIALVGTHGETLREIPWSDFSHAALVIAIAAIATFLYSKLGFLLTMPILIFALLTVVERRNLIMAAVFAVTLTLFAYWLFAIILKAPLESGSLWT